MLEILLAGFIIGAILFLIAALPTLIARSARSDTQAASLTLILLGLPSLVIVIFIDEFFIKADTLLTMSDDSKFQALISAVVFMPVIGVLLLIAGSGR